MSVLLTLCFLFLVAEAVMAARGPKLLLVSFDGFRWDYLNMYNCSWFHEVARKGVTTTDGSYLPSFTTKSFPGHFTMVTGLHQESHGIVENTMFDPHNGAVFSLRNKTSLRDPFWWNAEPIWITAERQGRRAGTFFWPGSEVSYGGVRQKFWKIFDSSVRFSTRVDTVIHWLSKEDVSLATLYFEEPDLTGHKTGPFSSQMKAAVEKINRLLGYLIRRLKEEKLFDSVHLVLTSDHGLSNCNASSVVPFYKELLKHHHLISRIMSLGAFFGVNARPGQARKLYEVLKSASERPEYSMVNVYRKDNVPPRFYYRNNRRIPDVVVLAQEGYFILSRKRRRPRAIPKHFGCHGYDNMLPDMRPFFIARGPQLRQGYRVAPFHQVDIYNLLASLLGVRARPNNGTWQNVEPMLNKVAPVYGNVKSSSSSMSSATCLLLTAAVLSVTSV